MSNFLLNEDVVDENIIPTYPACAIDCSRLTTSIGRGREREKPSAQSIDHVSFPWRELAKVKIFIRFYTGKFSLFTSSRQEREGDGEKMHERCPVGLFSTTTS